MQTKSNSVDEKPARIQGIVTSYRALAFIEGGGVTLADHFHALENSGNQLSCNLGMRLCPSDQSRVSFAFDEAQGELGMMLSVVASVEHVEIKTVVVY
jgi:hypothetical protein